MTVLKTSTLVLKVTDFEKNRLPSDFNDEVEGVDVEFLNNFEIQDHKLKFLIVTFKAFKLLIQERLMLGLKDKIYMGEAPRSYH
jgi:hypothetical protein